MWLIIAFSLSLRLFFWSTEALWIHFPARASKTLSRKHSALPPIERAPEVFVNRASPVSGTLLVFCVNQGISASFSLLYFLIGQLWTTRFRYIKGPQQIIIRECDMKRILQSLRFILLLSDYFCNIHGHTQVCIILWSKLCDYNTFNICIIHTHTYYIYYILHMYMYIIYV